MEKLLEMKEICKSFGTNNVLKNVQFDLFAGEVHALIGENGAGKSTLMKILMGMYKKDSGSLSVLGSDEAYTNTIITGPMADTIRIRRSKPELP